MFMEQKVNYFSFFTTSNCGRKMRCLNSRGLLSSFIYVVLAMGQDLGRKDGKARKLLRFEKSIFMEVAQQIGNDRVRKATPDKQNEKIDQKTEANIRYYANADTETIKARLAELDKEWDIERTLELNASLFALGGVILGATVNKKWLILPAVVTAFLAQHAIQGWCPPVPLFRKLGIRTQKEIETERHALLQMLNK
jgi:hypothetical protein